MTSTGQTSLHALCPLVYEKVRRCPPGEGGALKAGSDLSLRRFREPGQVPERKWVCPNPACTGPGAPGWQRLGPEPMFSQGISFRQGQGPQDLVHIWPGALGTRLRSRQPSREGPLRAHGHFTWPWHLCMGRRRAEPCRVSSERPRPGSWGAVGTAGATLREPRGDPQPGHSGVSRWGSWQWLRRWGDHL